MRAKLFITCLLAACSGSSSTDDGTGQIKKPTEGIETQGSHLLGEFVDGFGNVPGFHPSATTHGTTKDGRAVEVTFTGLGSLEAEGHVGSDPFLDSIVLDVEGGGQLKIHPTPQSGSELATYHLESRPPEGGDFRDPCAGETAVVFTGRWTTAGLHVPDAAHLSFACGGAVAYKCTIWGYTAGSDPSSILWRAHQACTRMARADYCSDGTSHTRDGTTITIYDRLGIGAPIDGPFEGIKHWPPLAGKQVFEAAWNDGDQPASCLGRVRWQSLPIGGACPLTKRDPREDVNANSCDDYDVTQDGKPLLFNESRFQDLALYVWQKGKDRISTIRGFYDTTNRLPDQELPNGYSIVMCGDQPARDAMLIRSLTDDIDPALFDEVWTFTNGVDDAVVARVGDLPPNFKVFGQNREGFVRKQHIEGKNQEFVLYHNPTTDDWLSTSFAPPAGYDRVTTIGNVLPAEGTTAGQHTCAAPPKSVEPSPR